MFTIQKFRNARYSSRPTSVNQMMNGYNETLLRFIFIVILNYEDVCVWVYTHAQVSTPMETRRGR